MKLKPKKLAPLPKEQWTTKTPKQILFPQLP
jgi:hypothetical protein